MAKTRMALYVTPKSACDEVAGWRGGELFVRVRSAPENGRANAAAAKLLASELGVPKSAVSVVRGHKSRHKQVLIEGASQEQVDGTFGRPPEGLF